LFFAEKLAGPSSNVNEGGLFLFRAGTISFGLLLFAAYTIQKITMQTFAQPFESDAA
jgi:hypothetical protein